MRSCSVIAILVAGCGGHSVDVLVCGDLQTPADIDAVRLAFRDDAGDELSAGVVNFLATGAMASLPVQAVLPGAEGPGWAVALGLKDGVEVARFERRVPILEEVGSLEMILTQDCYRAECPLGQTCVAGACSLSPVPGGAPTCEGRR